MNHDEKQPHLHPWTDPELEARIVAWVAGEASPFEVAELERLVGEKPELALFKQRMEALHGLVGEAVRPDKTPLRLSDERRAHLLQTVGASALKTDSVLVLPSPAARRKRRLWQRAATIAAGLMIGLFFTTMIGTNGMMKSKRPTPVSLPVITGEGGAYDQANPRAERSISGALEDAKEHASRDLDAAHPSQSRPDDATEAAQAPKDPTSLAKLQLAGPPENKFSAGLRAADQEGLGAGKLSPLTVEQKDQGSVVWQNYAGTPGNTPGSPTMPFPDLKLKSADVTRGDSADSQLSDVGALGATSAGNKRDYYYSPTPVDADKAGAVDHRAQLIDLPSNQLAMSSPSKPVAGSLSFEKNSGFLAPSEKEEQIVLSPFTVSPASKKNTGFAANSTMAGSRIGKLAASRVESPEVKSDLASTPPPATLQSKIESRELGAVGAVAALDQPLARSPRLLLAEADPTPEMNASQEPVSTFSLHVSDVSFRLAQAALARGVKPEASSIRPEEFYNAFNYGDPAPSMAEKISCRVEQSTHPVLQQRNLVRIAMKVPAVGRGVGRPLRLTLLLDTSGSMEREDRAAAVRHALEVLTSLLGSDDRVTLIGFARQPHLLAEQVPGNQAQALLEVLKHTPAEGGTNLEEALKLAGELASRQKTENAQNRIVLLTDGAANLGNADPVRLAASIEALRQQGIAFDACGVGLEGIDDDMLEALTRKGDGRYYVLNSPEAADAGFARQLAGAFRPAAENVKVQVRFNPSRVGAYRLVGFDKHRLKEEDFRNDRVDAAELAAEEAAVALYEVEVLPQGQGELGEVSVRFRDATNGNMVERSWTLHHDDHAVAFDRATPTLKLAGLAALLAEKFRGGAVADQIELSELASVANGLRGYYRNEPRVQQLIAMYEQLRRLEGK